MEAVEITEMLASLYQTTRPNFEEDTLFVLVALRS